jgi:hypothetical protein
LLAHGRWFTPASSTTKTGRHDIAEILLKVALKHQKSIKSNQVIYPHGHDCFLHVSFTNKIDRHDEMEILLILLLNTNNNNPSHAKRSVLKCVPFMGTLLL